jgi:hypothetical protein
MRFTVTALGSAGDRPVGVVVGAITRYLVAPEQRPEAPGAPRPAGGEGQGPVARYYADRGNTPGYWLGQGARELSLAGEVDFDEFTSVLAKLVRISVRVPAVFRCRPGPQHRNEVGSTSNPAGAALARSTCASPVPVLPRQS